MSRLDGKVALVTGAARGIGASIAIALAKAGVSAVIVNDLEQNAGVDSTVACIRETAAQVLFVPADVRNEEMVESMFTTIDRNFHKIDILVNNAGIAPQEDIFATSLQSWHNVIDTHLTGAFLCSRAAMFRMREQRSGRIIYVSSMVASRGAIHGFVHYAAAKAGQIGLARTLARTGAPFGITVNAIAPGIIETDMLREAHGEDGIRELAKDIPLGLGTPEDVAGAVVFLASDEARYMTGTVLDINGGVYFR